MFIGHLGLSLAAKKVAPKVSLGTLFIATLFVDILWPFLLLFDVEKVAIIAGYTKSNPLEFLYFPYTHSLLMGAVWGAVAGAIYWLWKRDTQSAIVIGICVLSHWFFDLVVHTADLPLTPFSDYKVGFGLWNNLAVELTIESIIFLAGVYIYASFTKVQNKIGKWGFGSLVVFLLAFQFSAPFSPPPASIMILSVSATIMSALIIALAYWIDKNRELA